MSGITRDDWLKALAEAGIDDVEDDQQAVTAAEFGAMFGLPAYSGERRLKALAAAGKATRTRKRVKLSNGRIVSCVAYRLVTPTKAKR